MAKKRGLAANRGLDALLGSIKKEKQITASALQDDTVVRDDVLPEATSSTQAPAQSKLKSNKKSKADTDTNIKSENIELVDSVELVDSLELVNSVELDSKKPEAAANIGSRAPRPNNKTYKDKGGAEDQISLVQIEVSLLQAGKYQPRRDMSETALTELASSIEQHGIMQPIVIRPLLATENKSNDIVTHEIIAGERRWRAAKMAGKTVIPAIERALSDELAIALALIENIQREDLSVIEQAAALQRFHSEFGMSHAMIAEVVGKARTTVSNLLRLNQLHDAVKDHLANSALDMGHARTLLALSSEQQPIIAQKIIDGNMTVREAEKLVKSILKPTPKADRSESAPAHDAERLTQRLTDALGAEVKLKHKKDGQGSVEIIFHNQDELAAIIKYIEAQR